LLAKGTLVFVPTMLVGMALTRFIVQPGLKEKRMMQAEASETP
jgi:hypothetical protein